MGIGKITKSNKVLALAVLFIFWILSRFLILLLTQKKKNRHLLYVGLAQISSPVFWPNLFGIIFVAQFFNPPNKVRLKKTCKVTTVTFLFLAETKLPVTRALKKRRRTWHGSDRGRCLKVNANWRSRVIEVHVLMAKN